jgi:DNA mismatch endonuclease, patch repair protein
MHRYDSKTELILIRELQERGEKFRTQAKKLPGTPDILFTQQKLVVFVHGCFWHRHSGCSGKRSPRNNWMWWVKKFNLQVKLDQKNYSKLRNRGWWVYIAWECNIKNNLQQEVDAIQIYLRQRAR